MCQTVLSYLGPVDNRDSRSGAGVIQDNFRNGGCLGTEPDVECGMGVLRAVYQGHPAAERAQAGRSPARSRRGVLDCSYWCTLARSARGVRQVGHGLPPVTARDLGGPLADDPRSSERQRGGPGQRADDRLDHRGAHHCAARAKGALRKRILAVQKVASRPRPTSPRTGAAFP